MLDLRDEGAGRVVAFVTATPEWVKPQRVQRKWALVAPSFEEYLRAHRLDRDALIRHLREVVQTTQGLQGTTELMDIGLPDWRKDPELQQAFNAANARCDTA